MGLDIDNAVRSIAIEPYSASLGLSLWSNDASDSEMSSTHSVDKYIELYRTGRIRILKVSYKPEIDGIKLYLNLKIERWEGKQAVEIICFREPILEAHNPKKAMEAALAEFKRLKDLFGGVALFIGPDTLDYPKSAEVYPSVWIKIN